MAKILVLNTGYMKNYSGTSGDPISGGFKYLKAGLGTGHEVLNFEPSMGKNYGYAPVRHGTINIQRLGARPQDDKISGITVVWTAPRPGFGKCIVGWYENATVYKTAQTRMLKRKKSYYNVVVNAADAHLIPPDERNFHMVGLGVPGTSSSWFVDQSPEWFTSISDYIASKMSGTTDEVATKLARSSDPIAKAITEQAAMQIISSYYRANGYEVEDCSAKNKGWDLEAILGKVKLRLEVKGLSGNGNQVELTPNEYNKMRDKATRGTFRICIVTGAGLLDGVPVFSQRRIFQYDESNDIWCDDNRSELNCQKVESARLTFR